MERRLLDWARAVKAVRHSGPPPLWLFTDTHRLPDPLPSVRLLPPGLSGVVFRHDDEISRPSLARAVARLCRARRIALVVAGDARLAARMGAGLHLRNGRHPGAARWRRSKGALITSSAHDPRTARRAFQAGADLVFISPLFPTRSHESAAALGPSRWARLARHAPGRAAALGGIDGRTVRRIPKRLCRAAGAIGALAA